MSEMSPVLRTLLVLAIWVAGLAAAAQFAKVSVIFAEVSALYPDAGAAQGFLLSLISFVGVVFGVSGGALVARIGPRPVLIGALALGAGLSALQAMLPPLPVMLGLRLVEGFSHLGVVIAAPTLIATLAEGRWQGAALTLWGSFFGVSFALTAWLGVPMVRALGVPALFLAHGAVMLSAALLLWAVLPRVRHLVTPGLQPGGLLARHVAIYRSARLSASAWGWLFYTLTYVSILAVLPSYLAPDVRIFAQTTMPIVGIALSLTLGVVLLRRVPAVGVVIVGFGMAGVAAGTMALAGAEAWVAITLFAVLGLVQGASFAAVPQLNATSEARALANGALAQMGNTGNLLGTPVLLAITGAAGLPGLVWFAVLAYALGGAVHMIQAMRRGSL